MGLLALEKQDDRTLSISETSIQPDKGTWTAPGKAAIITGTLGPTAVPGFVKSNSPRGFGPVRPHKGLGGPTVDSHPGRHTRPSTWNPTDFINAAGIGVQTFDLGVTGAAGNAKATGSGQNGSSGNGQGELGLDPLHWGLGTIAVIGLVGWAIFRKKG